MTTESTQELLQKVREHILQTQKLVTESRRLRSETDALIRASEYTLSVPIYPTELIFTVVVPINK